MQFILGQLSDIATIQDLAMQAWDDTYGAILSENQLSYMFDMMYSNTALHQQMQIKGHIFYIAYIEEKTVGFISFELVDDSNLHIQKLYVIPTCQGQGVGFKLIRLAEDYLQQQIKLKKLNLPYRLSLNVNRSNKKAIAFYQKHHFIVTQEMDIDVGEGFWMNDYRMERNIIH